jgi:hypothetical protein
MKASSRSLATRLLDRASVLIAGEPPACPTALRHRAAAFLARQALEDLLEQLWRRRAPGLENASVRAQLACLPEFVRDEELVAKVRWAWGELTAACHAGASGSVDTDQLARQVEHLRALATDPALMAGREGAS